MRLALLALVLGLASACNGERRRAEWDLQTCVISPGAAESALQRLPRELQIEVPTTDDQAFSCDRDRRESDCVANETSLCRIQTRGVVLNETLEILIELKGSNDDSPIDLELVDESCMPSPFSAATFQEVNLPDSGVEKFIGVNFTPSDEGDCEVTLRVIAIADNLDQNFDEPTPVDIRLRGAGVLP